MRRFIDIAVNLTENKESLQPDTVIKEPGMRTFMRLHFSVKPFEREKATKNPLLKPDWKYQDGEIPKHLRTDLSTSAPETFQTLKENVVPGPELLTRYHGKSYRYRDLPEMAKKSLTQYMVVEGENDEYKKQRYGYVEVPVDDLMRIIYDQQSEGRISYEEFWGGWYEADRPTHKKYNEIWPIIWGSIGWEDGAHRLEVYRGIGLKMIPVVVIL